MRKCAPSHRQASQIMFAYVQKLQIAHLIPLKTINIVSYNTFSKPRPRPAGF